MIVTVFVSTELSTLTSLLLAGVNLNSYSFLLSAYFGSAPSFLITEKSMILSNGSFSLSIARIALYSRYPVSYVRSKFVGFDETRKKSRFSA